MTACLEKSWISTGIFATSALPPVSAGSKVPERTSARRGWLFQPTSAMTESPSAGQLREHVDPGLRERLLERRVVGNEDARCAVLAEHVGHPFDSGAEHDRDDVVAELRRLAEHSERAFDGLTLVMLDVDQGRHQRSLWEER
jgi:hypothetical protein